MSEQMYMKLSAGFWGFILGAIVAMLIGFQWAGWTTAGTTQKMNDEAVLMSQAAICAAQFQRAPDYKAKNKEYQGLDDFKKSEYIEKGGWDKMPGQDTASWGVSSACVAKLNAPAKSGT